MNSGKDESLRTIIYLSKIKISETEIFDNSEIPLK